MICPLCGSEYREGYLRCRECDTDLIDVPPREPDVELVRIYETGKFRR